MSRENFLEEAEKFLLRHFSGNDFSVTRESAKPFHGNESCETLVVRISQRGRQKILFRAHVAPDGTVYFNSTPLGGGARAETVPTNRQDEMQVLKECTETQIRRMQEFSKRIAA